MLSLGQLENGGMKTGIAAQKVQRHWGGGSAYHVYLLEYGYMMGALISSDQSVWKSFSPGNELAKLVFGMKHLELIRRGVWIYVV